VQQANRLAGALIEAGIQPGDRVALLLENGPDLAWAVYGVLGARAVIVPMNPATKPDKTYRLLNDCGARGLVAPHRLLAAMPGIHGHCPALTCVMGCGQPADGSSDGVFHCERDLSAFPDAPPPRKGIDSDLAAIIYTSGSTGRPKGVMLTHFNMVSAARSVIEYLDNNENDIILNVLPMSFSYGLHQLLTSVMTGATLVAETSFAYPYRIAQRIQEECVTGFPGVPTVFAMLLQLKEPVPAMFDTVRYVTNAGAAIPPAHIARLTGLFRRARFYSMYGVTECKRVSYLPPEELERRPASVGRGMPNQEHAVVNAAGEPVAPGEVGELVVRGSHVMQGYWNLPGKTARVLRQGRYPWEKVLYTGDLFTVDEDGFLYFVYAILGVASGLLRPARP
jgi:long-chain acyl-CoA synthetase